MDTPARHADSAGGVVSAHASPKCYPIAINPSALISALTEALCAPEVIKLYTASLAEEIQKQLNQDSRWSTVEMVTAIVEAVERQEFARQVATEILSSARSIETLPEMEDTNETGTRETSSPGCAEEEELRPQ